MSFESSRAPVAVSARSHEREVGRPRIAVVLNGNARSVNERLVADLRGLLQDEALYVSHSLEQARFIARHIVNQGFDVVLSGGGDGTFTQVITDIAALRPARMPAFGLLRLGTGNAMAEVLGAKAGLSGVANDLRHVRLANERLPLPLIKSEGRLSPFAGVGLDAMILEDYGFARRTLGRVLGKACEGPVGYAMAIAGRTSLRLSTKPLPQVVIRNEGAPAYRIDRNGQRIGRPIARGEEIYRGKVTIAAASTIPFYGFRFRLFPQADTLRGRFQLRVGHASIPSMLAQLPQLFSGHFAHEQLWDYSCTKISMHCAEGTPYQIGGDLVGSRQHLEIGFKELEGVAGSNAPSTTDQGSGHPQLHSVA